jgi:hypothetical protein
MPQEDLLWILCTLLSFGSVFPQTHGENTTWLLVYESKHLLDILVNNLFIVLLIMASCCDHAFKSVMNVGIYQRRDNGGSKWVKQFNHFLLC